MELAHKKQLVEIKKRSISNFESFRKNSKINVPKWVLYSSLVIVLLNIVLLSIILFSNIYSLRIIIDAAESTKEQVRKAREVFAFSIIAYLFNCLIDGLFIFYIYRAYKKSPIGNIFCFTWLTIWMIFTVGVLFVFDGALVIRILNAMVGFTAIVIIMALFYLLQKNKKLLMYSKEKEKYSL